MKALVTARRIKAGHEDEFRRRWAGGPLPRGMRDAWLLKEEEDPCETLSISLWDTARDLLGYRTSEEARQRRDGLADVVDKDRWSRGYVASTKADVPARGARRWLLLAPAALALAGAGAALLLRRRTDGADSHAREPWQSETWSPAQDAAARPSGIASTRAGMLVRELMTPAPRSVEIATDAATAATIMRELNVGALPVLADGNLAGIITDRDLALGVAERKVRPADVRVGDLMSVMPVTVSPATTVEEAARLMADHQVRRLPVMEGTRLVGMLSLGDLAADGAPRAAGAALEEISEPAAPQR